MSWDSFFKWFVGLLDLNFISICFIFLMVMLFLWLQDRSEKTQFKIVNFFKTNGNEDIAKLVMFLMTIVLMWGFVLQVKDESLDIYMLCAYMIYALGAPMAYAALRTVVNVFGKPDIVNHQPIIGNGNGNGNGYGNGHTSTPTPTPTQTPGG